MGAYARTLMTLAVGLIDSQSPARRDHFTSLLLDAPAVPPPLVRLLRATCALPLGPVPGSTAVKAEGAEGGADTAVDAWGFGTGEDGAATWAGESLPTSPEALSVTLETVRALIEHRPVVRAQCLEIALECAVSTNEDLRTRAVRLVSTHLHPTKALAAGIEAFATYHLDEASTEGAAKLESATKLAEKAVVSMRKTKEKKERGEQEKRVKAAKLKAEAEGRTYKPGDEDAGSAPVSDEDAKKKEEDAEAEDAAQRERMTSVAVHDAVRATARHVALFCALCVKTHSLLPRLFDFYAKLPPILRPAVVEGVAFDSLVRHVGPTCAALVDAIAAPPRGAETLVRRAVEVLADTSEYSEKEAQAAAAAALEAGEEAKPPPPKRAPAALIAAVEALAAANGDDVTYLVPLLGSFDAKRVKSLVPKLVGSAPEIFADALNRLTASNPPRPLTAPEIIVALHDVDPARDGVPLKRIIDACGACFDRPGRLPRRGARRRAAEDGGIHAPTFALHAHRDPGGERVAHASRVHARVVADTREAAGVEDGSQDLGRVHAMRQEIGAAVVSVVVRVAADGADGVVGKVSRDEAAAGGVRDGSRGAVGDLQGDRGGASGG
jgi:symplekin